MYHNFFIHSPVDGHLGCFYILATVNSVAMKMGYMCLFPFWFPQSANFIKLLTDMNHLLPQGYYSFIYIISFLKR